MNYCVLANLFFNTPDHVKCISLNTQQCVSQRTPINVHPKENIEGVGCYSFAVILDKCIGCSNILNDLHKKYVFQTKQKIFVS